MRGVRYIGYDGGVTFCSIEGGGWMQESIVGHVPHDVDATRVMWEFFEQHPLRRE